MNILVCVKRVPATGGRIILTADGQDDRHPLPRLHGQPARGVRGRGGGPDRRGARRQLDRPDPRAGRRRTTSSATRWRSGSTGRSCSRPMAGTGTRSATAAAIVDAIRGQEAAGRTVRPDPVRQRGGRQRRLPGRDPGRRGPRIGRVVERGQGARDRATGWPSARREGAGGGWEVFELPLPAVVARQARGSTCRATRRCRAGSGPRRRRSSGSSPTPRAGGLDEGPPAAARPSRRTRSRSSAPGAEAAPAVVELLVRIGARRRDDPVLRRARSPDGPDAVVARGADPGSTAGRRGRADRSRRSSSATTPRPRPGTLGAFGVSTAHVVDRSPLDRLFPGGLGRAARPARRIEQRRSWSWPPGPIAATRSWPTSAAFAGSAMAANCIEVEPGEPFRLTRQRWAGSLLEDATLDGPVRFLTIAPSTSSSRSRSRRRQPSGSRRSGRTSSTRTSARGSVARVEPERRRDLARRRSSRRGRWPRRRQQRGFRGPGGAGRAARGCRRRLAGGDERRLATPRRCRSARPGPGSRLTCTSPAGSAGRSSTSSAARRPRRSSRSIPIARPRS